MWSPKLIETIDSSSWNRSLSVGMGSIHPLSREETGSAGSRRWGGGGDAGVSASPEAEALAGGTAGGLAGTAGPAGAFLEPQCNTAGRRNARDHRRAGADAGGPRTRRNWR